MEGKKESFLKVGYWILCALLIISVFLLLGLLATSIYETNPENYYRYIGLLFGLCGAIIGILGIYRPVSLLTPLISKKTTVLKASKTAYSIWFIALGFSWLLGGVICSFTGKLELLMPFIILPHLLVYLLGLIFKIFLKKHKN